MLRRLETVALAIFLAACVSLSPSDAFAQKKDDKKRDAELSAETIAESVILVYGSRPVLEQVRRTGVERGRMARTGSDGASVEIDYERSFKRGDLIEKDKIRLDQKRPNLEYSIIYNDGRTWGVIKGTQFVPRQEELADFEAHRKHGIENLLRYKENGATINYAGKDKQKNIDMWLLDLTDKEGRKTRYYISSQTGKVLWLEYEHTPQGEFAPVKFRRTFHDYRVVQGTRVPYRSVLYANDRKLEESQINTVIYGVKMDDENFKSESEAATSNGF